MRGVRGIGVPLHRLQAFGYEPSRWPGPTNRSYAAGLYLASGCRTSIA
jgi:hypothetical protein